MTTEERLILLLALMPHIQPSLLDILFTKNSQNGRIFAQFGGIREADQSLFAPTGETAVFMVAGQDLIKRLHIFEYFETDHFFAADQILKLVKERSRGPLLSGELVISPEILTLLTVGKPYRPSFSSEFPASEVKTRLDWDDLVLEDHTRYEINEIHQWLKHGPTIMDEWNLGRNLKPGFRALFYGPPGTGKTLTATLLGKSVGKSVYRVDLSKVVSKYIGETEKNMANIFDQAENKDWLLFFDEADALFGKRTATKDSKDRYANQEISYLLQRIEDFPGIVILASNLKGNIDDAFSRRFQSMIYFPIPSAPQRQKLWEKAFQGFQIGPDLDFKAIAEDYKLAGGSIINVLRHSALMAAIRGEKRVIEEDVQEGIRREFKKEGKTV